MTTPTTNPGEIKVALRTANACLYIAMWYAHKSHCSLYTDAEREEARATCADRLQQVELIASEHPSLRANLRGKIGKVKGVLR